MLLQNDLMLTVLSFYFTIEHNNVTEYLYQMRLLCDNDMSLENS